MFTLSVVAAIGELPGLAYTAHHVEAGLGACPHECHDEAHHHGSRREPKYNELDASNWIIKDI